MCSEEFERTIAFRHLQKKKMKSRWFCLSHFFLFLFKIIFFSPLRNGVSARIFNVKHLSLQNLFPFFLISIFLFGSDLFALLWIISFRAAPSSVAHLSSSSSHNCHLLPRLSMEFSHCFYFPLVRLFNANIFFVGGVFTRDFSLLCQSVLWKIIHLFWSFFNQLIAVCKGNENSN